MPTYLPKPPDYDLPEADENGEFEEVVRFKVDDAGLYPIAIGGVEFPVEEEEEPQAMMDNPELDFQAMMENRT